MRTSFDHQPEAQHPKSSAIHKLPADYPIFRGKADMQRGVAPTARSQMTPLCHSTISFAVVHSKVLTQRCGNVRPPP
jgi:hypothetical protein